MEAKLFAAAPSLQALRYVSGLNFSASNKKLGINIDSEARRSLELTVSRGVTQRGCKSNCVTAVSKYEVLTAPQTQS